MRVLVVEDDPDLAEILQTGLAEEGYAVDLALTGQDGKWRATTVDYDLVMLDVMLPDMSGFDILREMRRLDRVAPVLILTARDDTADRVTGLDLGADDYLVKPFAWEELLARLRALLRRGAQGSEGCLRFGDLVLDPAAREVRRGDEVVPLTAKEFEIVYVLMREPERVFTRSEIIERIYDDDFDGMSNVIDVFFSRIRRKITGGGGGLRIRTVRGVGYALSRDASA